MNTKIASNTSEEIDLFSINIIIYKKNLNKEKRANHAKLIYQLFSTCINMADVHAL